MNQQRIMRRLFLKGSMGLAASSMSRVVLPGIVALAEVACTKKDQGRDFAALSPSEAQELSAIADRILPRTDSPGAADIGIAWFMDEAFDSFMAQDLEVAREGLAMLARRSQDSRFSNLEPTGQDQILTQIEDTAFFALVRNMTIYGYFGMHQSTEGFDDIAWTSLGVNEPVHAWEPPFGYYDGEYLEGAQDGE